NSSMSYRSVIRDYSEMLVIEIRAEMLDDSQDIKAFSLGDAIIAFSLGKGDLDKDQKKNKQNLASGKSLGFMAGGNMLDLLLIKCPVHSVLIDKEERMDATFARLKLVLKGALKVQNWTLEVRSQGDQEVLGVLATHLYLLVPVVLDVRNARDTAHFSQTNFSISCLLECTHRDLSRLAGANEA
ncbi:hypothetical protein L0F63_002915, partial [Massospora cicadina]